MDKKSSISSSKYISSSLDNISLNANISLTQMKEAIKIIDEAAYALIIPILKIQNKIITKFNDLTKEQNESKEEKEKADKNSEESDSEMTDGNNDSKNEKKMINFSDNIKNNIYLFNNISSSEEYEKIINSFNELLPDNGMFIEKDELSSDSKKNENDYKNEKGEINKISKENNIIPTSQPKKNNKKKRKPLRKIKGQTQNKNIVTNKKPILNKNNNNKSNNNNNNNNLNKKIETKKKSNNSLINKNKAINEILEKQHEQNKMERSQSQGHQMTRKQKKEIDLLHMIQKDYPTNSFIQRMTKSFLSRRLFRKVIYQHIFNYNENGSIDDKKVKGSGESGLYKNCKATFQYIYDKVEETEKLDEFMGKELRQEFVKLDEDNCEYIIAGKLGCSLYELIQNIFKKNLLKEFSVVKATLEFYEFYEELVSEFNEKEENVKIISCDKITLRHIREDWKNILICREYVTKKRREKAI